MNLKRIISTFVIMTLMMNVCGFALAENEQTVLESDLGTTISINIQAEPTAFSVTVPTSVPIYVNDEIMAVCPEAAKVTITNSGYGAIRVNEIQMENGSWSLVDYGMGRDALLREPAGSNQIGMKVDLVDLNESDEVAGVIDSAQTDSDDSLQSLNIENAKWRCYPGETLYLQFSAIISPIDYNIDGQLQSSVEFGDALNMVFVIGWYTGN